MLGPSRLGGLSKPRWRWKGQETGAGGDCLRGCTGRSRVSPGPWSAASCGCPGPVDIRSLKCVATIESIPNFMPLTVVATLSHRICTYMNIVSSFKKGLLCSTNLVSNHHSLLRSFPWPVLSLLSGSDKLSGGVTLCITTASWIKDRPRRSISNSSES